MEWGRGEGESGSEVAAMSAWMQSSRARWWLDFRNLETVGARSSERSVCQSEGEGEKEEGSE